MVIKCYLRNEELLHPHSISLESKFYRIYEIHYKNTKMVKKHISNTFIVLNVRVAKEESFIQIQFGIFGIDTRQDVF